MYSKRIVISIIVIGCLAHVSFVPFYNIYKSFANDFRLVRQYTFNVSYKCIILYILYDLD